VVTFGGSSVPSGHILRTECRPLRPAVARRAKRAQLTPSSATTSTTPSTPPPSAPQVSASEVKYRSLESNTWVFEVSPADAKPPLRIFVDPWLVGFLEFFSPAFYRASKSAISSSTKVSDYGQIDAILISQNLPDHLHTPTLSQMPKNIPIICDPSSVAPLTQLGFSDITPLPHGCSTDLFGGVVSVAASPGALVGPPWATRKNAYTVTVPIAGEEGRRFSLFYEPHADPDPTSLAQIKPVDAVLTPITRAALLPEILDYPLVKGIPEATDLVKSLGARKAIVLQNGSTAGSGVLDKAIEICGTRAEFEKELQKKGLGSVEVVWPPINEPVTLAKSSV